MDFSSIVNQQGYKYIESPVIYKFPSDKFMHFRPGNQSANNNNELSINKIGQMLFRREHLQLPNHNHTTHNNEHELQLNSIVSGGNHLANPVFHTNNRNDSSDNKNQTHANNNGRGLFGISRLDQSIENKPPQLPRDDDKTEFDISSSQENISKTQNLYHKIESNTNPTNARQQPKRQSAMMGTFPYSQPRHQPKPSQQHIHQRKPSVQFAYYKKLFSPQKSSTLLTFKPLPPHSSSLALPPRPSNAVQQINRLAANQLIYQTQRQLLQGQISSLKIQLKTFEERVEQLSGEKEEWVRCKKRNEILEREYKVLNEEYVRMKESSLDIRRRSSEVERVDLAGIGSEEEFGRRAVLNKRPSDDELLKPIYESKLKQYQDRIDSLQHELRSLANTNKELVEQKLGLKQQHLRLKSAPSSSKQPHTLQKQLISLKQQTVKLQQQKQSYVHNYKILKTQRQKQCKQLKLKQQQIHDSLQRLSREINSVKLEKNNLEEENRKIKKRNLSLEEELQVMIKKYSTIKYDCEEMNHTLQMNTQQQFMLKTQQSQFALNEQKHFELQKRIQTLTKGYDQRIEEMTRQHERQKVQTKSKHQAKLQDYEQKVNEMRRGMRELENTIRDKQSVVKEKQNVIRGIESEVREKEEVIRQKDRLLRDKEDRVVRDKEEAISDRDQRLKDKEHRIRQLAEKLQQCQERIIKFQSKTSLVSQNQSKHIQHQLSSTVKQLTTLQIKLKQAQTIVKSLQQKLQSQQSLLLKKQAQIDDLVQKRQQRWSQLLEIKQKYLELNEINLKHISDVNHLKVQLTKKQEEKSNLRNNLQSQLHQLNSIIASQQQQSLTLKQTHHAVLIRKENQIKKQRAQIQGLLVEVVKLRQVKNHNYKLMQLHKKTLQIDSTVTHLWAIKETQYENIAQLLGAIKDFTNQ